MIRLRRTGRQDAGFLIAGVFIGALVMIAFHHRLGIALRIRTAWERATGASGKKRVAAPKLLATGLPKEGPVAIAIAGMASFPPTDHRIVWSPGNVYFDRFTHAHVTQNGTYFKTDFSGKSFSIVVDISGYHMNHMPQPNLKWQAGWGQWLVSVDGKYPVPVTVGDPGTGRNTTVVKLASDLAPANHTIEAWYDAEDQSDIFTPKDVQVIDGIVVDGASSLAVPSGCIAALPNTVMVMGDSITDGFVAVDPLGVSPSHAYPLATFACILGRALNAEMGSVGLPGQGWTQYRLKWTLTLPQTFNRYDSKHARIWPSGMTALFVCEGTNDDQNDVQPAARALLPTARKAVGRGCWVFLVVPFNGHHKSELAAAVTTYKAAHPTDRKVALLDPSAILLANTASLSTVDGTHPNNLGHAEYAAILAGLAQKAMAPNSSS